MAEDTGEMNIRELSGEIQWEIELAARFQDLHEELSVGGLSGKIDTVAIRRLLKNEPDGFSAVIDLMMFIMARHCGRTLVNCNEMAVDPLPERPFKRFGEDNDD